MRVAQHEMFIDRGPQIVTGSWEELQSPGQFVVKSLTKLEANIERTSTSKSLPFPQQLH